MTRTGPGIPTCTWIVWRRELIRFLRQPGRWIAAIGTSALIWVLLGSGFARSLAPQVATDETISFAAWLLPGMMTLVAVFSAIFSSLSTIEDRPFRLVASRAGLTRTSLLNRAGSVARWRCRRLRPSRHPAGSHPPGRTAPLLRRRAADPLRPGDDEPGHGRPGAGLRLAVYQRRVLSRGHESPLHATVAALGLRVSRKWRFPMAGGCRLVQSTDVVAPLP